MLDVEVDLKPLGQAVHKWPEVTRKAARLPLLKWQGDLIADFIKNKLNGRSGNAGLNVRTGRTLRGNIVGASGPKITGEDGTGKMGFESVVGFIDPQAARIARVHELGTTGAGGSLPDILPKRFRFLWIPVTNMTRRYDASLLSWAEDKGWIARRPKTVRKAKNKIIKRDPRYGDVAQVRRSKRKGGQEFILLRRARIPPRLGFGETVKAHMGKLEEAIKAIPATVAKYIVMAMKGQPTP